MTIEKYALAGTVINFITDAWAASTAYDYNDALTHNGVTYRCILPHTSAATDEPGVGVNTTTYWAVLLSGNAAIAATALTYMGAYSIGETYTANASLVSEAKSGYGDSLWLCKSSHTGASGKNPTGASGSTYWDEAVGGGENGVSSLTTALDALGTTTDAPVGDTDLLVINDGGTWKKITADKFRQGYVMHQATAAAMVPQGTDGCSDPTTLETTTNKFTAKYLSFDYDKKRYAHFSYSLPKSYTGGALKAYIGHFSTGTTTKTVLWGIEAACVGDGDSIDAAWGAAVGVMDACQGTAYKLLMTAVFDGITPAGVASGDKELHIRVHRNPWPPETDVQEAMNLLWVKLYVPVNLHSEA